MQFSFYFSTFSLQCKSPKNTIDKAFLPHLIGTIFAIFIFFTRFLLQCPKYTFDKAFLPLFNGTIFAIFRFAFQDFSLQLINDEKILEVFL